MSNNINKQREITYIYIYIDQKEKRASEDEMAGWHHQCNGCELGQTSGNGEGQGGLACCSSWGHKDLDTIGCVNNIKDQVASMITDIKNTLERLKNISEQAERINELGNRSTKIIQSSKRKKK